MTEGEAKAIILESVPRETFRAVERYVDFLTAESARQNLIAKSTLDELWLRHILDAAQLVPLAPLIGPWVDLGSGAGLPGLVVAALSKREMRLVEPRAKRAAFLREAAGIMGIGDHITVIQSRAETSPAFDAAVISARAVAALDELFAMGHRFSTPDTTWILPKGRTAAEEVAAAQASWHARIRLVPSITDSEAAIVVATDVAPRKGKRA